MKTPFSHESALAFHERARHVMPGGVNSNFRLPGFPIPMAYSKALGSRLTDVDGNEYIDYALGYGPHILGHSPQEVVDAVEATLGLGQLFAGQHMAELELAELLVSILPGSEMVRIGQSGTEMDQLAVRLARASTGKSTIVRFAGHYHGWLDPLFVTPDVYPSVDGRTPITPGQSRSAANDIRLIPWNDERALSEALSPGDVAAVIMEPMMNNTGAIVPQDGYLERAADLCREAGSVLIFDEVITGFRLGLEGAQCRTNVRPDLTVYAKGLAAGYPVAVLGGKRELLELTTGGVMHGGTYNTGVSATVAALATVRSLQEKNPYPDLYRFGDDLMAGIRDAAARQGVPVSVDGLGPVFHVRFGEGAVTDYSTFVANSDSTMQQSFLQALYRHGVRVTPRGTWFTSAAHSARDMEETLGAVSIALEEIAATHHAGKQVSR